MYEVNDNVGNNKEKQENNRPEWNRSGTVSVLDHGFNANEQLRAEQHRRIWARCC